jgi:hypothetical protein
MQRHARTKFRKKGGAPFITNIPIIGGGMMMNKKLHSKAHDKMGVGKPKEADKTKQEVETPVEEGPGKAPENKKEE